ncbi:MAG: hypothetical protein AABW58_02795 [Nanoarchaeota archaeon]|mgnify:CR=1 FL=1
MKEETGITTSDIVIPSLDLGETQRSQSGRRRAVETFQGERGDLVSISLKPGYKVGKDSTGKKLMFVKDPDDNYSRAVPGVVTWLSKHCIVLGLVSCLGSDKVDLDIEIPIETIDSYRTLGEIQRSWSGRRIETFQGEKGDLASISLKPGYIVGKDSTGKKLMFIEDLDETNSRRVAGIVDYLSKHYVGIGLVSRLEIDKVDLDIEIPREAISRYQALTADMSKCFMI